MCGGPNSVKGTVVCDSLNIIERFNNIRNSSRGGIVTWSLSVLCGGRL